MALGSTFMAVPVVVLDNLPADVDQPVAVEVAAPSTATTAAPRQALGGPPNTVTVALAAPTTTTTEAPAPPTTEAPAPPTTEQPAPTTATTAPAPTTTAPPPPTTAPPAPDPDPAVTAAGPSGANTEAGKATWYRYRDGECAHKTLPKGTVVTITHAGTGAQATCTVTDRGPFVPGRIIDLDDGTFAQLAPLSQGVVDVTITW